MLILLWVIVFIHKEVWIVVGVVLWSCVESCFSVKLFLLSCSCLTVITWFSMEEAKKNMYAFSTTTYTGFQCTVSEETSEKFKGKRIPRGSVLKYLGFAFLCRFLRVFYVCLSCFCIGLPGVLWVLPDSYIDVKNKDYGGQLSCIGVDIVFYFYFFFWDDGGKKIWNLGIEKKKSVSLDWPEEIYRWSSHFSDMDKSTGGSHHE